MFKLFVKTWFFLFIISLNAPAQSLNQNSSKRFMKRIIEDTTFNISESIKERHLSYIDRYGDKVTVYILEALLEKNKTELRAGTPFDKDTIARQTVLNQMQYKMKPSQRVIAGINADFFNMATGNPVEMVIRNGKTLKSSYEKGKRFVGVKHNGEVIIGHHNRYEKEKSNLSEALGGNYYLVDKGKVPNFPNSRTEKYRQPRTALGINNKTVYFVVVDGRQPKYSNGITLKDLSLLMLDLNSRYAINLDGGGSSTFVTLNKQNEQLQVKNKPSSGSPRAVANIWAIIELDKE